MDNPHNSEILREIAEDEKNHYDFWEEKTQTEIEPSKWRIFLYLLISKIFGIMFTVKLLEKNEVEAQTLYEELSCEIPGAKKIIYEEDEHEHEHELIEMLEEERLNYIGAIIRGLNDVLVEVNGALAGLTFILQNTLLIGMSGLITGIAASLSMAGSEYLASKSGGQLQSPRKAAFYTGFSYIITVMFLISPYLILENIFLPLIAMIVNVIIIINIITFYISVVKDVSFKERLTEMTLISVGIAMISFLIGYLIRTYLGVEI